MGLYADELAAAQKASRQTSAPSQQRGPERAGSSPVGTPRGYGPRPGRGSYEMEGEEQTNTVFVGSIAPDTDDRALREFFNQFGRVLETKVVYDIETGRSRGFGFVKFDDPRDAEDAINDADGKVLDGRNIKCNIAKYPRGGGTGFRGGGRGRGDFRGRGRGPPPGGRFGPRRSRSPGRYSPGRYSPGRYSAGGRSEYSYSSRSMSRTPSPGGGGRSRSPPRKRGRGSARSPGGRRHRRRAASYSSGSGSYTGSGSSSSGSFSTTGSEGSRSPPPTRRRTGSKSGPAQAPSAALPPAAAMQEPAPAVASLAPPIPVAQAVAPAPALAPAPSDAYKTELVEAKRREEQMQTRIVALEGEVQKSRAQFQELEGSVTALASHLQTSEESRKQYRKWLSAFTECAKALSDSRDSLKKAEEQVKERSEDMDKFVAGVKVFLSKEKSSRRAKRDKERTTRRVADEAVVDGGSSLAAVVGSAATEAAPASALDTASLDANGIRHEPADAKGGGWAERMDVDAPDALQDAEAIANKFKPGIKFKLAT